MKYAIVKMGPTENPVPVPSGDQIKFHVVQLIYSKGTLLMTHASMDDVISIRPHLHKITIGKDHLTGNPESFWLNAHTGWHNKDKECSACHIAWYTDTPQNMFFVPGGFADGVHYKLMDERLGVFDVTNKDVIFKAVCEVECTATEIIEGVLNVNCN